MTKTAWLKLLKAVGLGVLAAATVMAAAAGLFAAFFGWNRILEDFWPLDNSRVGPNLCASMLMVVLVIAHNEYRLVEKGAAKGESFEDILEDVASEIQHPIEEAEQNVAENVAEIIKSTEDEQ